MSFEDWLIKARRPASKLSMKQSN